MGELLINELKRIAATSDEGGARAANACLAMLNFAAVFQDQTKQNSGSEVMQLFAAELSRNLRDAAFRQIATEEMVQAVITPPHGATLMASLKERLRG